MRFLPQALRTLFAALALLVALAPAALAQQKAFASPEEAMSAFGNAIATNDEDALKAIFGANFRDIFPPATDEIRLKFLEAWAKSHAIQPEGDAKAVIAVGTDGWTFPVPLEKTAQGWRFDLRAGEDEIRIRRIGRNERAVMKVMLAIYDAEREYAETDRNGDGVLEYAQKFDSSPGKHDGLYWPSTGNSPESPLGPAVAAARTAGQGGAAGYYGYRYKILTAQGKNAPGGAFDYVVRGRMIGGFAVVAWPVKYGDTGVMSFMVNYQGTLYEKNLGPDGAALARAIKRFDPDPSWQKIEPGH
ncbi:MAG: DUF2950 domain-containing protein [Bacteroidota bacterium]